MRSVAINLPETNQICGLFFSSFIVVLGGGTLWHLQRFLQCIKYVILGLFLRKTQRENKDTLTVL
jgi:hypothetical protein